MHGWHLWALGVPWKPWCLQEPELLAAASLQPLAPSRDEVDAYLRWGGSRAAEHHLSCPAGAQSSKPCHRPDKTSVPRAEARSALLPRHVRLTFSPCFLFLRLGAPGAGLPFLRRLLIIYMLNFLSFSGQLSILLGISSSFLYACVCNSYSILQTVQLKLRCIEPRLMSLTSRL